MKTKPRIYFITGGTRSGKSKFAQDLALSLTKEPVYVATARIWDDNFRQRVSQHKKERGPEWTTFEKEKNLYELPLNGRVALIDCITLWLTNFFSGEAYTKDIILEELKNELKKLVSKEDVILIFVSNELGMGMHSESVLGRDFTDLHGIINQEVASMADEVFFMVSGIPIKIKG